MWFKKCKKFLNSVLSQKICLQWLPALILSVLNYNLIQVFICPRDFYPSREASFLSSRLRCITGMSESMQTRTNSGGPYLQGCEDGRTGHIGTLPLVKPARKKLLDQGRSMKDLHVTQNGLCLHPLQHTDNCSFKILPRVCTGKTSYLDLVTCSLTYSGLAEFQVHANLAPKQTDGNKRRTLSVLRK